MDKTLKIKVGVTILDLDLFWLRDHCRCSLCYNESNANRISDILEIPDDISVKDYNIRCEKLIIEWIDDHKSEYKLKFLLKYQPLKVNPPKTEIQLWNKSSYETVKDNCRFSFDQFTADDDVRRQVLECIHVNGLVFIDGVDPTVESTEKVVTQLFPIQKTFFGEMFTFSEDAADHKDTAYTNTYLAPHNDNTYFNDAAGLLVFHCIRHKGTGGESYFIDGAQVANKIKRENPQAFKRLTTTIVGTDYKEAGRHHKWYAPMIILDPVTGELMQIRYNMDDRLPLNTVVADKIRDFYSDLKLLTREFNDEQNQIKFKLNPGTVMLFDNWRLLHGRYAYTGNRCIAGCAVERTEFKSMLRINRIIE